MKAIANKSKIVRILIFLALCCSCSGDGKRLKVDGALEPPEPNFWGNTFSMRGVDSNKDGIRDDVERWLNRKFPGDENYNLRNLYKQEARAISLILKKGENSEELIEGYWKKLGDARECAIDIYDNEAAMIYFGEKSEEVQSKILNTPWRWFREDENASKLGGKGLPLDISGDEYERCDFEVKNEE